jgi:DNA modification methylase
MAPPERPARRNLLVQGDNLDFLATQPCESADLIVTDPPFGTGRRRTASDPAAGARAAPDEGDAVDRRRRGPLAFGDRWRDRDEYLAFLRPRLAALRALLRPHGSIVVHLDYRVVHAVKLEMDRIFGERHFVNEIIWHYTGGGRAKRYFSRKHDTLLWYAKGTRWTFNIDAVRQPYRPGSGYARGGIVSRAGKRYHPHPAGTPLDDVWEIPIVNPLSPERCGYPTQKPLRLLERLIAALSRPGDLVVDPFCGSGTAALAAARSARRWIACDRSAQAIDVTRRRLAEAGFAETYDVERIAHRRHSPA